MGRGEKVDRVRQEGVARRWIMGSGNEGLAAWSELSQRVAGRANMVVCCVVVWDLNEMDESV